MRAVLARIARGCTPGFLGKYYSIEGDERLVMIRVDKEVNFVWFESPVKQVPLDRLKVVWQGFIKPPFSGKYMFIVEATGDIKLSIDGMEIGLQMHDTFRYYTPFIELSEGRRYRIELVFRSYEKKWARVKLSWFREDGVLELVSSTYCTAQISNTVVIEGVRDRCLVELVSLGTIASATVENGVAQLKLPDVVPPIEACLRLKCGDQSINIACLRDIWGGDVYRLIELEAS